MQGTLENIKYMQSSEVEWLNKCNRWIMEWIFVSHKKFDKMQKSNNLTK